MKAHLALVLLILAACGTAPEPSAKLTFATGEVLINGAKAGIGHALNQGDTLQTLSGSQATITLYNSSVVRLSENTTVEVAQLTSTRLVELKQTAGETWTRVLKITGIGEYKITTPNAVATVRGTGFKVAVQDNKTEVAVGEGTVHVAKVSDGAILAEANVTIDQKAIIDQIDAEALLVEHIIVETIETDEFLEENLEEDDKFINRLMEEFDRDQLFDELDSIIEDAHRLIDTPFKFEQESSEESESDDSLIDSVVENLDAQDDTLEENAETEREPKIETRVQTETNEEKPGTDELGTKENPYDLKTRITPTSAIIQPIKEPVRI